MARPERNNVDYFPFYCEEGKKMFYLEETYGNDGFATFVKILRELAKTDYHYLDLSEQNTTMFLTAKCKVQITTLEAIIKDLVKLEKFDSILWQENRIIWCQDFIDSIQDAYKRRTNKCINYDSLCLHLISLGVRKPSNRILKGNINPQRKEKDSKVKEITTKKNTFDDVALPVEKLLIEYLKNEKLIDAIISNKKLKLFDKKQIHNLLLDFNNELRSKSHFVKTWDEYTSHFINWRRKKLEIKKDDFLPNASDRIPVG